MSKHPQKPYGKKGSLNANHAAPASDRVVHQIYQLTLTFQAPLLSQQAGTMGLGIDSMMQRYQNQYALNGSLVKGNLRHALGQLAILLPNKEQQSLNQSITRWLGYKPPEGKAPEEDHLQWDGDAARGKVYFDTFWCYQGQQPTKPNPLRHRIKINDQGTVEDGALMSIEDCFELDTHPIFTGDLRASFSTTHEQQQFEQAVRKALQLIPAMGSLKGIGFGRLRKALLEPKALAANLLKLKDRTYVQLRLAQPFCVGSTSPSDNRIQSENFISGAVLKGAIAQQYARTLAEPDLDKNSLSRRLNNKYQFDKLIVSHALPVAHDSTRRPLPIPLSLVSDGECLFDASGYTLEQLIAVLGDKTASFQLDWKAKEWAAAETLCEQVPKPRHLTLVRTAINAERNTAEESQLFSMECVDPIDRDWLCHIDLSQTDVGKRKGILKDLAQLLAMGLEGIGKTKAYASVALIEESTPISSPVLPEAFDAPLTVKLLLVTPARLLPRQLEQLLKDSPSDQQSDQALRSLYQDYWQTQSKQGLSMVDYFARQQRYGGEYLKRHYQTKTDYSPEWMTEAGSVFVLQVKNQQGLDILKQWQQIGLPAAPEADGTPATWQTTAFIPENGYGEILLNWEILAQYHSPQTGYPLSKKDAKS